MWLFRQRDDQPPDEGDEPDKGETFDEGDGKSSEHGSSVNRIELIVNAATVVLGTSELIKKLIEVLTHH